MPRIHAAIMTRISPAIEAIKINRVSAEIRDGQRFWVKQRRRGMFAVIRVANRFFRLADNPVHIWESITEWQRWEVGCFQMLHGEEGFRAFDDGVRSVWASQLPGQSLSDHIANGSITRRMFVAAGRDLAQAHARTLPGATTAWSHGDPHLGNILYDETADRARLIDFEVAHLSGLAAGQRHADDLLVFLQDLVGLVSFDQWLENSTAFLEGYGHPDRRPLLKTRLVVPGGGAAGIWWTIRTNYLPRAELIRRIERLRATL